jgi:hypothetical protein
MPRYLVTFAKSTTLSELLGSTSIFRENVWARNIHCARSGASSDVFSSCINIFRLELGYAMAHYVRGGRKFMPGGEPAFHFLFPTLFSATHKTLSSVGAVSSIYNLHNIFSLLLPPSHFIFQPKSLHSLHINQVSSENFDFQPSFA